MAVSVSINLNLIVFQISFHGMLYPLPMCVQWLSRLNVLNNITCSLIRPHTLQPKRGHTDIKVCHYFLECIKPETKLHWGLNWNDIFEIHRRNCYFKHTFECNHYKSDNTRFLAISTHFEVLSRKKGVSFYIILMKCLWYKYKMAIHRGSQ